MKRTESGKCYAACELLLLNGAPSSVIQRHCFQLFQTEPSLTSIKSWRKRIGVPSRCQPKAKAFPVRKPYDPFTPEERASLALHHKFNTLLAGSQNTQQRNAA